MFNWNEIKNGNHICVDDDSIQITVFPDKNGRWRGIRDERITEQGYDTAEEAMTAIEEGEVDFVRFSSGPKNTGWKPAKKGGYYCYRDGVILTAKQASSGSWYLSVDGRFVPNRWFSTYEEAARCADSLIP